MGDIDVISIDVKNFYLNVCINMVVVVLDKGENMVFIVIVVGDGVGCSCFVCVFFFCKEYLVFDGYFYIFGYVLLMVFLEGYLNVVKVLKIDWSIVDIDDIDQFDNEMLVEFILEQECIKKVVVDFVDCVKVIVKVWCGDKLGFDLWGDIVFVFILGKKFDVKLVVWSLILVDYQWILLLKFDVMMVWKIFENEFDKFEVCMKDNGVMLMVCWVIDEDWVKFQVDVLQGDEDYSFEY